MSVRSRSANIEIGNNLYELEFEIVTRLKCTDEQTKGEEDGDCVVQFGVKSSERPFDLCLASE